MGLGVLDLGWALVLGGWSWGGWYGIWLRMSMWRGTVKVEETSRTSISRKFSGGP
jgi:hypothetical protein